MSRNSRTQQPVTSPPRTASLKKLELASIQPNPPLDYTLALDPSHRYLAERGLIAETVAEFGVGYCPTGPLAGRIAIPIHDGRGELVAYAGRWPGQPPPRQSKYKFVHSQWKGLEVFNLYRVLQQPVGLPLLVVQGFFDVMKLWQLGFRRVVALMGNELTLAQLQRILWHYPPPNPIVMLFDENDAGRWGRERALHLLCPHTFVRSVEFAQEGDRPEMLTAKELAAVYH